MNEQLLEQTYGVLEAYLSNDITESDLSQLIEGGHLDYETFIFVLNNYSELSEGELWNAVKNKINYAKDKVSSFGNGVKTIGGNIKQAGKKKLVAGLIASTLGTSYVAGPLTTAYQDGANTARADQIVQTLSSKKQQEHLSRMKDKLTNHTMSTMYGYQDMSDHAERLKSVNKEIEIEKSNPVIQAQTKANEVKQQTDTIKHNLNPDTIGTVWGAMFSSKKRAELHNSEAAIKQAHINSRETQATNAKLDALHATKSEIEGDIDRAAKNIVHHSTEADKIRNDSYYKAHELAKRYREDPSKENRDALLNHVSSTNTGINPESYNTNQTTIGGFKAVANKVGSDIGGIAKRTHKFIQSFGNQYL